MGTVVCPSWALQHDHVKFIDDDPESAFQLPPTPVAGHELAVAATANLITWLCWLRSGALFALKRDEVMVHDATSGPQFGLPHGIGHVEM